MAGITPEKLAELRQKALALKQLRSGIKDEPNTNPAGNQSAQAGSLQGYNNSAHIPASSIGRDGQVLQWNERQSEFIELATSGESAILIGAAGTGKTTCMRGAIESLILSGKAGIMAEFGHKYLTAGTPGIVACAYTRRAVQNLRKAMPQDMQANCITIHKLLEYSPIYYEVINEETGDAKTTMRFEPTRNYLNPLSSSIHTVIIDESSMVSTELFAELQSALPHHVQFVFLGDIQQLPPVFGSAILGYKMLELPTVELTEVYRQALESPIIRLAHRILSGKPIEVIKDGPKPTFPEEWHVPGELKLHPWAKRISADNGLLTAAKFLTTSIEHGHYNPDTDIVLCPFNKAFGTIELNKHIANFLGKQRNAVVHEIVAGFQKHYYAVGDKVLFDKEDAIITAISYNGAYAGKMPLEPSMHMDRWGYVNLDGHEEQHHIEQTDDMVDAMLDAMSAEGSSERKQEASHIVTLRMCADDSEATVNTASEFNSMDLGYALTVHKSQGSEWPKVFLLLHQSHNTMLQRELLYTAITRAKKELYVICEPDHFIKGIQNQRITGNTLAEKAEFFKGKVARNELQSRLTNGN